MVDLGDLDKPVWVVSKIGKYSSSDTWDALRKKQGCVEWWQLVWFPLRILKHSFILWLAMKIALTTGDKLLKWGYQVDTIRVFCRHVTEDRNHLFFG